MSDEIISNKLNPKQKMSSFVVSSEFFSNLHIDNSEYSICYETNSLTVIIAWDGAYPNVPYFDVAIIRINVYRLAS